MTDNYKLDVLYYYYYINLYIFFCFSGGGNTFSPDSHLTPQTYSSPAWRTERSTPGLSPASVTIPQMKRGGQWPTLIGQSSQAPKRKQALSCPGISKKRTLFLLTTAVYLQLPQNKKFDLEHRLCVKARDVRDLPEAPPIDCTCKHHIPLIGSEVKVRIIRVLQASAPVVHLLSWVKIGVPLGFSLSLCSFFQDFRSKKSSCECIDLGEMVKWQRVIQMLSMLGAETPCPAPVKARITRLSVWAPTKLTSTTITHWYVISPSILNPAQLNSKGSERSFL